MKQGHNNFNAVYKCAVNNQHNDTGSATLNLDLHTDTTNCTFVKISPYAVNAQPYTHISPHSPISVSAQVTNQQHQTSRNPDSQLTKKSV